ncbi:MULTISPECIES: hypothetical protein [Nostoc]|nr:MULTISPECIES: hypothetical protein [Nostoc]
MPTIGRQKTIAYAGRSVPKYRVAYQQASNHIGIQELYLAKL